MNDVIPPPPSSNNGGKDGCWKWGAISCLGLGCLGVLAVVGIGVVFMNNPEVKKAIGKVVESAENAKLVERDFSEILQGLRRYATEKKKFPEKLEALVPNYLAKAKLKPSFDVNAKPYTYIKPPNDAPESFAILQYDLPAPLPDPSLPPWTLRMRMDGVFEGTDYKASYRNGRRLSQPDSVGDK